MAGLKLSFAVACAWLALGCGSEPIGTDDEGEEEASRGEGTALELEVPDEGRVYVSLATPGVVSEGSSTWDIAFEGYDVYTNGGDSGPGSGASFGPLAPPTMLSDTAPVSSPVVVDRPGGAFLRWYAYDDGHTLLSRFHVYVLRDGERFYKLQILSYYGERRGAPLSALYTVRYAEVTPDGASETRVATDLDATAETADTECLDLDTGERPRLTEEVSATSDAWHVCFRRDAISVNGGSAGPRNVVAVDLDAAATDTERLADIRELTPESELARFEAVDYARVSDPELVYRSDGIASAFAGRWLEPNADPPAPRDAVWFVIGHDGARYLIAFDGFTGATEASPGRIRMRVKAVR